MSAYIQPNQNSAFNINQQHPSGKNNHPQQTNKKTKRESRGVPGWYI